MKKNIIHTNLKNLILKKSKFNFSLTIIFLTLSSYAGKEVASTPVIVDGFHKLTQYQLNSITNNSFKTNDFIEKLTEIESTTDESIKDIDLGLWPAECAKKDQIKISTEIDDSGEEILVGNKSEETKKVKVQILISEKCFESNDFSKTPANPKRVNIKSKVVREVIKSLNIKDQDKNKEKVFVFTHYNTVLDLNYVNSNFGKGDSSASDVNHDIEREPQSQSVLNLTNNKPSYPDEKRALNFRLVGADSMGQNLSDDPSFGINDVPVLKKIGATVEVNLPFGDSSSNK